MFRMHSSEPPHGDRRLRAIYKEKRSRYLLKSAGEGAPPDCSIAFLREADNSGAY